MPHTLLDVAKFRNNDVAVGLIEENVARAPEVASFMSRVIPGTAYNTLVSSGQSSGAFRRANEGVALTKATLRQDLVQCYIFENPVALDGAISLASQGLGIEDLEAVESRAKALATMQQIGRQVWYGTSADLGFGGIKAFTPKTATAGTSSIVVDATGTTANTASSVYGVKWGLQDVHLVFGNNETLQMSEFIDQMLFDGSGRAYMGRAASIKAWVGMQIGNVNCVGRILNLTNESGKTLNDNLMAQLTELFPAGAPPDAFFMSRRSARQLAQARPRTTFSQAGVNPRAGQTVAVSSYTVTDYENIPVIVTDQILNTDAIE